MELTKTRQTKAYKIILPSLFLLSLIQFLIYYVIFGFYSDIEALFYIGKFSVSFIDGIFPISAALAVFFACRKIKTKALCSLLISLAKLTYMVPYYYLYFVTDVYDSFESILLSFLLSFMIAICVAAEVFVLSLILTFAEKRAKKSPEDRCSAPLFDFNDYLNFGIALTVILTFTVAFVNECIDAVRFFIDNSTSFTGEEALTVFISFVLTVVFSFIYYLAAAKIKNTVLKAAPDFPPETD